MFSFLVLAVIALVSLVTASPIAKRTASLNDATVPTFVVSHQGQEIQIRGTIQEVVELVEVRHPGYLANLTARMNENPPSRVELEPRNKGALNCLPMPSQQTWVTAQVTDLWTSLAVLNYVEVSLYLASAGCARISCTGSSAIIFCSDVISHRNSFTPDELSAEQTVF